MITINTKIIIIKLIIKLIFNIWRLSLNKRANFGYLSSILKYAMYILCYYRDKIISNDYWR